MHTHLTKASNAAYEETYLEDWEHTKSAADGLGKSVAVGAGGGAIIGALTSLLRENPSLRETLKSTLVGGGVGAALGGGAHALSSAEAPATALPAAAPTSAAPASEPPTDEGMSLPIAALSGMVPGLGPAVHGATAAGPGQAAGSAAASLLPAMAVSYPSFMKSVEEVAAGGQKLPMPGKVRVAAMLASILGATGAAYAGNKHREANAVA